MGKRASIYYDRAKQEFVGLDEKKLKGLRETYSRVNVDEELKKMGWWLTTPKGSRRVGNIAFILKWLGNCEQSSGSSTPRDRDGYIELDTPIRLQLNEYLKELWKNREHILELNKKS